MEKNHILKDIDEKRLYTHRQASCFIRNSVKRIISKKILILNFPNIYDHYSGKYILDIIDRYAGEFISVHEALDLVNTEFRKYRNKTVTKKDLLANINIYRKASDPVFSKTKIYKKPEVNEYIENTLTRHVDDLIDSKELESFLSVTYIKSVVKDLKTLGILQANRGALTTHVLQKEVKKLKDILKEKEMTRYGG